MVNYSSAMTACPNHCKYFLSEALKDKRLLSRTNLELSEMFNVSRRTIQRWLETLKKIGFFVINIAKKNKRKLTYGQSLGTTRVTHPSELTPYNKYVYKYTYTTSEVVDNFDRVNADAFLEKMLIKKMGEIRINKTQAAKILNNTKLDLKTAAFSLDFFLENKKGNTEWWQERKIKNPAAYFRTVTEQGIDLRPNKKQKEDEAMDDRGEERKSLSQQQVEKKAERRQAEVDDRKRKRLAQNVNRWLSTLTDEERKSIEGCVEPLKKPNLVTHYIKNIANIEN